MRNSSIVLAWLIVRGLHAKFRTLSRAPVDSSCICGRRSAGSRQAAGPRRQPPQDPGRSHPRPSAKRPRSRRAISCPALGHNLGDDVKHLPRMNTVYFLAGGGARRAAVHPCDDDINQQLSGSARSRDLLQAREVHRQHRRSCSARAPTTYLIGRGKKNRRLQHLGMDEIEGQLLAGAIVLGLKESVRRERPVTERRHPARRASRFRRATPPRRSPRRPSCSSTWATRPASRPTWSRPTSRCRGCTTTSTSRATSSSARRSASSSAAR